MASMDTNTGNRVKKGQPNKLNLRVDFTPMVDMNMLLITFFMFCTTLAKPQIMDIVMPTKDQNIPIEDRTETIASRTVTLLLGEDNKVFYYWGIPDYQNTETLQVTNLTDQGLRSILLDRNTDITAKVSDLKRMRLNKQIGEEDFKQKLSEIKKDKGNLTVLIKPMDNSDYSALVKTLDEMQICSIGRYAIVNMEEGDKYLYANFNNSLVAQAR